MKRKKRGKRREKKGKEGYCLKKLNFLKNNFINSLRILYTVF